jgi:hypothetical protein
MRCNFVRVFASCLVVFFAFANVIAQDDDALGAAAGDKYVISARAGHVNFVQGAVGIVRKVGKSGALLKGDLIEVGDRVSTGPDGKAEILLNPGSFVRLGPGSAFEFQSTSLDDLKLQLDSGTAILEVYATQEFKVEVQAPKTMYTLIETGVYRLDVIDKGVSRLQVWRGLARVDAWPDVAKGGRVITTNASGSPKITKFDRDDRDLFDNWSRERGRELTQINARLRNVNLRPNLLGSFREGWWNLYNTFGLWIYDPFFGGYAFLPFGHRWPSPYGWGYDSCVHHYNLPSWIYAQPPWTPMSIPGATPVATGGTPTANPTSSTAGTGRVGVPVFVRMQDALNGGGGGGRAGSSSGSLDNGGGTRYDGGHSSHSSSSSSSSPSSSSPSPPASSPPPSSPPSDLGTGKGKP